MRIFSNKKEAEVVKNQPIFLLFIFYDNSEFELTSRNERF